MASEARLKAGLCCASAAMAALAASAALQADSPRLIVLCALAAMPAAGWFWHCLRCLTVPPVQIERQADIPTLEQRALIDNVLELDARLEHAPIALFSIEHGSGAGMVHALNANARRLVAPGRATDLQALQRLLHDQAIDARSMIAFDSERGVERALVSVSALTVRGKPGRLAALMPVESELEAEALNAWRQLVHVLTHEIMNSLTPVASLSRTAFDLLDESRAALAPDVGDDLATALDAISRRSASLVEFVGSYRSLSNLPQAKPERVRVGELFARAAALETAAWQQRGGAVRFAVEPASLELMVDAGQLEQALINLAKNAFEATAKVEQAVLTVSARLSHGGRLRIEVSDNGPGVPDALIGHIFTPFFSTKKHGSGIGLAMVRQLIHGNGGTVRYAKSLNAGAQFVITF